VECALVACVAKRRFELGLGCIWAYHNPMVDDRKRSFLPGEPPMAEVFARAHAKFAIKQAQRPPRSPFAEDGFAAARERREFEEALGEAIEEHFAEEARITAKRLKARRVIARARDILAKPQPAKTVKRGDLVYKVRMRKDSDNV
jgi:hypothetical protein